MCILEAQASSDNIIKQQFVGMQDFALMGIWSLTIIVDAIFELFIFIIKFTLEAIFFKCFPFFLLVVWCVGLSFKFFELFHYSNVKLLQVLCLMAPLKPPSIFKYKALFGFQLPTFPLNFFPSNFVLLESSHAPLVLLILTLLHYAMLLLHLLMHSLILFILTLLHQAMLL